MMYLLTLPTPLTVEDPSDDFVALRDYLDCRNALTLSCFQPPVIHELFGDHTVQECRERLKLNKVCAWARVAGMLCGAVGHLEF